MPAEKFYCGNCGSPLYYGRKFKEHTLARACPRCQSPNPTYFHYCYRCGEKIVTTEADTADETV